jgi:hypothetical protein
MTSSAEKSPSDQLHELFYPNSLRGDDLARTYVDGNGTLYLQPLTPHDFEASRVLLRAGLASGEGIMLDTSTPLVKYPIDTDLIPLPAVFNSSLNDEKMIDDVVSILQLVRSFFHKSKPYFDIDPASITMDMFALNRGSSRIEPLPPFLRSSETMPPNILMKLLAADALLRSSSDVESDVIASCFQEVIEAD